MATANDVISRAGRRALILAGEEVFTAAELSDALQLLNDMLHNFGPRGISYAHTTLAASDTVNVPDELLRPLVLLFTEELLMDFGGPIDPLLAVAIADAKNELQAGYHLDEGAVTDPLLRPRLVGAFDITRLD